MTSKKGASRREDVDFRVLRLIEKRPGVSQREIAKELDISLGAANYCLRALIAKGHVKVANFRKSKNKIGYIYALTPQGVARRAYLAICFIERKLDEYRRVMREIDEIKNDMNI